MKIGSDADFSNAVFAGGATFNAAEIGGDFIAYFTKFNKGVNFESMKVGRNGLIRMAEFGGLAKFTSANFTESLEAHGAKFNDETIGPRFDDMKVGTVVFDIKSFRKTPIFGGMRFEHIVLVDVSAKKRLEGLESNESLIQLTRPDEQSTGFNTSLQEYLRKLGDSESADELFIAQKRKERETYLTGLAWLKSRLLDFLVAYGREPWRAFVYSALIIVMGSFIFRNKSGMELQEKEQNGQNPRHRVYNPFWYSLDLFAPVIDLKVASVWAPDNNRRFARNYI
jgi:hypothetical protein